ncbi:MAG: ATPase [Alphaproteobacteria bacterium]|nr:ATPase [Alphaproteobacteria bacterium]
MTSSTAPPPRRLFTAIAAVSVPDAGFGLTLDGRRARTPAGGALVVPRRALAERLVEEWSGLGDRLDWAALPLTRLAAAAIDEGEAGRARNVASLLEYAGADLLCYFADGPEALVRRQEEVWGGLLDWARETHGLAFRRARGIIHQPQSEAMLARLGEAVAARDAFTLAGLAFGAALFGSTLLALALAEGRLDADAAFAAARLDEAFQEEVWGVDDEAAAKARRLADEAHRLEAYFRALD